MTTRAFRIALLARRFGLLADRIELLREDRAERVEVVARDAAELPNALDVQLVGDAGPLDVLCAYALRRLRGEARERAAVLDVLGVLPSDWLLGIAYALSDRRRRSMCRTDGIWALRVNEVDDEMAEAVAEVARLTLACDDREFAPVLLEMRPDDRERFDQFNRGTLGLTDELTEEDRALLDGEPSRRFEELIETEMREAVRRARDRWRAELASRG